MLFKRVLSTAICLFLFTPLLRGAEIRAVCNDTQEIREKLSQKQATYLGEYIFTDFIYRRSSSPDLNEEFIRIRSYEKTGWKQKAIVVAHKAKDELENIQKIVSQTEHECLEEALQIIPEGFVREFSFSRQGWEYQLNDLSVYIEKIEGMLPSIEVLAPSYQVILDLFENLEVIQVLTDSVPEWYRKTKMVRS